VICGRGDTAHVKGQEHQGKKDESEDKSGPSANNTFLSQIACAQHAPVQQNQLNIGEVEGVRVSSIEQHQHKNNEGRRNGPINIPNLGNLV
jgi:hypothetical protein